MCSVERTLIGDFAETSLGVSGVPNIDFRLVADSIDLVSLSKANSWAGAPTHLQFESQALCLLWKDRSRSGFTASESEQVIWLLIRNKELRQITPGIFFSEDTTMDARDLL
jgi:hypothetical protein